MLGLPTPVSVEETYRVVGIDQARVRRLVDDVANDLACAGEPLSDAGYQALLDQMVTAFLNGML